MNFSIPLLVSPEVYVYDPLNIKIINNTMFRSMKDNHTLETDYKVLKTRLIPLAESDKDVRQIRELVTILEIGVLMALIIPMCFFLLMKYNMDNIWSMYHML